MTDESKLRECPFCGEQPNMYEQKVDVGGGDHQYICRIICECAANPVCYVEGEHGYKRNGDIPNDEAKSKAIKAWDTRTEHSKQLDGKQQELLKRAKEYAEFFEATKNFNTLGFFNDLIEFLSPNN